MLSLDPLGTRILLVATQQYKSPYFTPIDPAIGNIQALRKVFLNKEVFGLPSSHIKTLINSDIDSLVKALKRYQDDPNIETFIFYYVGHGYVKWHNGRDHWFLTTSDTEVQDRNFDDINRKALVYETLKDYLEKIGQRRIVIFDSCYSGQATQGIEKNFNYDFSGTFTISSASAREESLFDPADEFTYFSKELISILSNGINNNKEYLSVSDLYEELVDRIQQLPNIPNPTQKNNFPHKFNLAKNSFQSRYQSSVEDSLKKRREEEEKLKKELELKRVEEEKALAAELKNRKLQEERRLEHDLRIKKEKEEKRIAESLRKQQEEKLSEELENQKRREEKALQIALDNKRQEEETKLKNEIRLKREAEEKRISANLPNQLTQKGKHIHEPAIKNAELENGPKKSSVTTYPSRLPKFILTTAALLLVAFILYLFENFYSEGVQNPSNKENLNNGTMNLPDSTSQTFKIVEPNIELRKILEDLKKKRPNHLNEINNRAPVKSPTLKVIERKDFLGDVENISISVNAKFCAAHYSSSYGNGAKDNTIRVWECGKSKITFTIPVIDKEWTAGTVLAFSPDEKRLLYQNGDKLILKNLIGGEEQVLLNEQFYSGVFHPYTNDLVFLCARETAFIYDMVTKNKYSIIEFKNTDNFYRTDFCVTNNNAYFSRCFSQNLIQFSLSSLKAREIKLPLPSDKSGPNDNEYIDAYPFAISADEKYFSSVHLFDEIHMYQIDKDLETFNGPINKVEHDNSISHLEYLDDQYLASTSVDRSVAIWNTTSQEALAQFSKKGSLSYVGGLVISKNQRKLLIGALYGVTYLFEY
ncbi:MAG: caspase family protein [Bacteroidota bacterium]